MKDVDLLSREEFERNGFIYEPDRNKCETWKLRLYVPDEEWRDEEYKKILISELPCKYIHRVWITPNPYEGDPNFFANYRVLVTGHTPIEK